MGYKDRMAIFCMSRVGGPIELWFAQPLLDKAWIIPKQGLFFDITAILPLFHPQHCALYAGDFSPYPKTNRHSRYDSWGMTSQGRPLPVPGFTTHYLPPLPSWLMSNHL